MDDRTVYKDMNIAYFISPHGYGHAARAAGIMTSLQKLDRGLHFEIFTTVPEWFFKESIPDRYTYHFLLTDIGFIQETPLRMNLKETVMRLEHFLPFDDSRIRELAGKVSDMRCRLLICDIAPMGIAIAGKAGIPSVLVENFTWDWLYEEYIGEDSRLIKHIEYLRNLFHGVDYHIQARPVCVPSNPDLATLPVCRKARSPSATTRKRLSVPDGAKVVLITMGGIKERYPFLDILRERKDIFFIIPGYSSRPKLHGNLSLLPRHSEYFHPDLINASDAVIGKVGYSTLSEVYYSGNPFGYVARENFRESGILVSFIEREMAGIAVKEEDFVTGEWISQLSSLLDLPRLQRSGPAGADQAAGFIYDLVKSGSCSDNHPH